MDPVEVIKDAFGLFDAAAKIFIDALQNVIDVFVTSIESLDMFNNMLLNQHVILQDMIDQVETGYYEGVNIVTLVGAYRYLVGDILFYYTYLVVTMGAGFLVYRTILVLFKLYKDMTTTGTSLSKESLNLWTFFKRK